MKDLLKVLAFAVAAAVAVGLLPSNPASAGSGGEKRRIILDTDIGDDVDDAYALALALSLPNARLLGVTTAFGQTRERAQVAAKLLAAFGRADVPVYAGRPGGPKIGRQHEWARAYRSRSIRDGEAVEFQRREIERAPGKVALVAVGPLTNVGDLLTRFPEVKANLREVVIMGGAIHAGYNGTGPATPEWNIKCDPAAARALFESGVPVTMAGLEVTAMMKLDPERQKRLFAAGSPGTDALAALTNLWGGGVPVLYDPVAVAHALGSSFTASEKGHVAVDDSGLTRLVSGSASATILIEPRKDAFLDWYVQTVGGAARR